MFFWVIFNGNLRKVSFSSETSQGKTNASKLHISQNNHKKHGFTENISRNEFTHGSTVATTGLADTGQIVIPDIRKNCLR